MFIVKRSGVLGSKLELMIRDFIKDNEFENSFLLFNDDEQEPESTKIMPFNSKKLLIKLLQGLEIGLKDQLLIILNPKRTGMLKTSTWLYDITGRQIVQGESTCLPVYGVDLVTNRKYKHIPKIYRLTKLFNGKKHRETFLSETSFNFFTAVEENLITRDLIEARCFGDEKVFIFSPRTSSEAPFIKTSRSVTQMLGFSSLDVSSSAIFNTTEESVSRKKAEDDLITKAHPIKTTKLDAKESIAIDKSYHPKSEQPYIHKITVPSKYKIIESKINTRFFQRFLYVSKRDFTDFKNTRFNSLHKNALYYLSSFSRRVDSTNLLTDKFDYNFYKVKRIEKIGPNKYYIEKDPSEATRICVSKEFVPLIFRIIDVNYVSEKPKNI